MNNALRRYVVGVVTRQWLEAPLLSTGRPLLEDRMNGWLMKRSCGWMYVEYAPR